MKPPRAAKDTAFDAPHDSYQGRLLIAMPGLSAPPFDHSVIYLCQHDAEHAMGLILNQPIRGLRLERILKELGLKNEEKAVGGVQVFNGGPVQSDRGFVLHSLDYQLNDITVDLGGPSIRTRNGAKRGLGLTISRDILLDMAGGAGPEHALIALGYAGWGPGQLEDEIAQNAWLVAPASQALIFMDDPEQLWTAAVTSLGVTPGHLSGAAGNA
jgi:putative transcriptional regulator